jgi:hypothetical protein
VDLCVLAGALLGLYVGLGRPVAKGVPCKEDIGRCVTENLSAGMIPVLSPAAIGVALGLAVALFLLRAVPLLRRPT